MSEHRGHLSLRIIRVAILYSKEVESVKHFSLERHSPPLQGKRAFPSHTHEHTVKTGLIIPSHRPPL